MRSQIFFGFCVLACLWTGFALAAPMPDISWNAADPGSDPANEWAPSINNYSPGTPDSGLTWTNNGASLNTNPTTGVSGITASYEFESADSMSIDQNYIEQRIPDTSNADWTIELWLRPDSLPTAGSQVIIENGGSVDGSGVWLEGTELNFLVDNGGTQGTVTADLAGVDTSEFVQAIFVYDRDAGGDDTLQIYLNAALEDELTTAGLDDTGGSNGSAIAGISGNTADGIPGGTAFAGEFAIYNFYGSALTADEIEEAFFAVNVVPEPTSIALWSLLALGLASFGYRRIKRRK